MLVVDGIFGTIPTVGILQGRSFCFARTLIAVNLLKLKVPDAYLKDATGKPFVHQLLADTLINAKVLLPNEDSQAIARVVRRAMDGEECLIRTFNKNPLLNTLLYECKFNNGTIKEYTANTIASNIFMELDADGFPALSCIILWIINAPGRQFKGRQELCHKDWYKTNAPDDSCGMEIPCRMGKWIRAVD